MTNPPEAEKLIHFQLDQMSARNEHHRFEEICFRVARRRLSSNVKLASGPVSAGGDQGRDVESFVTWLPEQLPHAKGFVARATNKPVVVACTLQKADLPAKVKADVAKICAPESAGGELARVDYIAFCSVVSIPAAKQHELQQWARDTHDVHLEIFDGLALSSMLAEFDLVWVAQDYLDLPSHLVPDFPGEDPAPEWYGDLLGRCRRGDVTARSLGDLAQLRPGLRHATFDDEAKADLPEWLGFMAGFLDPAELVNDEVAMLARYEIAVAHIRGLESLAAVEPAMRDFIRFASAGTSLSHLEDARVLLLYMGGAMAHGLDKDTATVAPAELAAMHADLTRAVASLRTATDAATYPVRNARLLQLVALLALHPDYARLASSEEAGADVGANSWLLDVDGAMAALGELVEQLPRVPALPVESLARQFEMLLPVLVDAPGYEKVRDGLDAAMARLEGDAAAAHRSRDRAMKFLDMDRPFDALREFHVAKEKWWHGDTLRGSLLAMRMIARLYASLGMTLAAKQYRCTAASLALTSTDGEGGELGDMIADALVEAMDSAYQQGAWLDAAGLGHVAVLARHSLVADAFDYDRHAEVLGKLDFDLATCVNAARSYWPSLEHVVMTALGSTGWEEGLLEVVEETKVAWMGRNESQFLQDADRELSGTPFYDAGQTRTITFAGLGTRWYVEVANERAAVLAAERFCAATQILLCELVGLDPLLVPQDVRVQVRTGKPLATDSRVRFSPSNTGLECTLFLTPYSEGVDREALDVETFNILGQVLFSMSFRSDGDVTAIIEETAKSGLLSKLNVGRSYDEVAGLLDFDHYEACRGAQVADRATPFMPVEVQDMAAPTGPGPGYDHAEALAAVESRYERISDMFAITLARVVGDVRVRELLGRLRADGWLDWHLVAAVVSVANNYRANALGYLGPGMVDRKAAMELFQTKETADSMVVPLEQFDEHSLAQALKVNAMTVGQAGWGLTAPTQTPNLEATLAVLRERYGYGADDVPHLDLLGDDVLDEHGGFRQMLDVGSADESPTASD